MATQTREQIIDYARKLEQAGASSDEIEEYVSLASKELNSVPQVEEQQTTRIPSISEIGTIAKTYGGEFTKPLKAFGKGIARGATFGALGQEEEQKLGLEGSVFQPEEQKTFGKAGEYVGIIAPLLASEVTGGAALGLAAGMRGAGTLGKAVASGVGTGMTFEAAKGTAEKLPPLETGKNMAVFGSVFGGLSMGGQALGYLRKVLGENLTNKLANTFINTKRDVAEKLFEQGKPSLGRQYLEKTDLAGFENRKEVYNKAGNELARLENQINQRLKDFTEEAKKPTGKEMKISGIPQLEYKPTQVQEVKPSLGTSQPIATPTNVTEYIPEIRLPEIPSKRDRYVFDEFGVPVRIGENIADLSPPASLGGFERTTQQGTKVPEVPISVESKQQEYLKQVQKENIERWKNEQAQKRYGFKVSRENTVEINDIANTLDELADAYKTGTRKGEVAKINRLKEDFVGSNKKTLTVEDIINLKRKLDRNVSRDYLKGNDAKQAISSEVDEVLANRLREVGYAIDPELGQMMTQESLLIRIRSGLKSVGAEVGGTRLPRQLWDMLANSVMGSPAANLTAKTLYKNLGTPSKIIAPITRQGSRSAVIQVPQLRQ